MAEVVKLIELSFVDHVWLMRAADRHLTREQSSERKQLLILTDTAGLDEGDDRPTKTAQNQDSC